MMKKIITLVCFIVSVQTAFTQSIDSLFSKIAAEKDDNLRVKMLFNFFSKTAETDAALSLKNVQKLLAYSLEKKDKLSEAYAIAAIGYNYRGLGNTEKSLEYALKADAIARETGNEILRALTNNILGNINKDLGNYPKALNHFHAEVEIGARLKYDIAQSMGFQNLGEVYLAMGRIDSALMYEQKDYELCMRIGFFNYFGYTLLTLGAIHGKLGNPALAIGYFDMAIQEGIKTKSSKQLSWAYTAKAQYFYNAKQIDSSLLYAKKAIATVNNTAFSNYSIKPAKILLDIYENSNSDSAIKYFKLYKAANDSLFSTKTIQQTQLMTFENEIKQQEIAAEKLQAEEQRKQNIQYALLALGIITFIILFLMLSRRHITNTKLIQFLGVVALLLVFEFLNLLLHPFLERITHHSPVLMLLALVCIAALLVPLHHKLEKWATHKLVEKNKAIRLASAKKTIEELERK
jgi:tetratricopeptide (TPR) repeat protein